MHQEYKTHEPTNELMLTRSTSPLSQCSSFSCQQLTQFLCQTIPSHIWHFHIYTR